MQVDLTGISVCIAMPVFANMPPKTVRSLIETQAACLNRGMVLDIEMNVGSTVFHARSLATHRFLKSDCTRLFFIDSDMVWTPEDFFRFLALSTKMDCVSAAYPARTDPPKIYISFSASEVEANEWGCLPVDGLGLGFTILSRHVLERLAEKAPKLTFSQSLPGERVAKIFRFDEPEGEARGEDMAFFADVKALGVQPWLDLEVNLGHVGEKEFRASIKDFIKAN